MASGQRRVLAQVLVQGTGGWVEGVRLAQLAGGSFWCWCTRGAYKLLKCRCKYLTAWCCQFKLKPLPQKLRNPTARRTYRQHSPPPTDTRKRWRVWGQMDIAQGHAWIDNKGAFLERGSETFLYDCTLPGRVPGGRVSAFPPSRLYANGGRMGKLGN